MLHLLRDRMQIFVWLAIATLSLSSLSSARSFYAVSCINQGNECLEDVARMSQVCRSRTAAEMQSLACLRSACEFCEMDADKSLSMACSGSFLKGICHQLQPQLAMASSERKSYRKAMRHRRRLRVRRPKKARKGCTLTGTDRVVISLGNSKPEQGWSLVSRGGYKGIVFEKERNSRAIIGAGRRGVKCFNIRLTEGGQYYTTAITASPHNKEHNDVWIKSSKGFRPFKNGRFRGLVKSYVKGFQNLGRYRMADMLKTIDHNGHYLITTVGSGERFQICISGRSSKFEMFSIVLVRCFGNKCSPGDVRGRLRNLKPSGCT